MTEIVGSVRRVTDIIGEITASTAEQRDNIGQISQAVRQLDQMTQQNAALVEQSTAASESLREQARGLASAVSQFKLSDRVRTCACSSSAGARTRAAGLAHSAGHRCVSNKRVADPIAQAQGPASATAPLSGIAPVGRVTPAAIARSAPRQHG